MSAQGSSPLGPSDAGGRVVVVRFTGDLDLSTEPDLRARLARLFMDDPVPAVLILDLGREGFCSVRGLTLIVDATEAATALGVELVVARPQASLLRVLRIFGWEHRIRLVCVDVSASSARVPRRPGSPEPRPSSSSSSNPVRSPRAD